MEQPLMKVTDADLGVWFGIDGKSIKTQSELDLAVIALAGVYGFDKVDGEGLKAFHEMVSGKSDEELCSGAVDSLIWYAELAIRHLNEVAKTAGCKFDFTGERYEFLGLYRL